MIRAANGFPRSIFLRNVVLSLNILILILHIYIRLRVSKEENRTTLTQLWFFIKLAKCVFDINYVCNSTGEGNNCLQTPNIFDRIFNYTFNNNFR